MTQRGLAARCTSRWLIVLSFSALLFAMPTAVFGQFDLGPPDGPMPPSPPEVVDRVAAVVLDAFDGHPLDSVSITIIDRPRPAPPASATSDASGKFTFDVHHPASRSSTGRPESANVYLALRRPGYLPFEQSVLLTFPPNSPELRLKLTPEGVLHGTLKTSSGDEPSGIPIGLFRRQIRDGVAVWLARGNTKADAHGEFQFHELPTGDYKIATGMWDVRGDGPPTARTITGYPPIFSGGAHDLPTAAAIHVSAGRTSDVTLPLRRTPFYNVSIPLADPRSKGLSIIVGTDESPSGVYLGLSGRTGMIDGFLPDGAYDVHITTVGRSPATVSARITVKVAGARIQTEPVSLTRSQNIAVNIHEDFTVPLPPNQPDPSQFRRLNLFISPAGTTNEYRSLGNPIGTEARNLQLWNVEEGAYFVFARPLMGYIASIRSNGVDLAGNPLVVGPGGASAPIEVTLRNDDTIMLSGTVFPWDSALDHLEPNDLRPLVTCIPLDNFALPIRTTWPRDGKFTLLNLAPGRYLVLASRTPLADLEYRNADILRQYQPKGTVISVDASQQPQIQVPMMESAAER